MFIGVLGCVDCNGHFAPITLCLFIGALGRSDYSGHYAPIAQVKHLMRGVYHGEFYVQDVREMSTSLDPFRSISKEMAKGHIRSEILEETSAANAEPGTL